MKFRRETEFQETEIGEIPRDWKVVEFGVLFDFQRGLSYRKNDISTFRTPIRFITINDLEKEGGRKRDVEPIYLSEELEDSIINRRCTVEIGDILIAITDMSKGFIIGAPLYIDETLRNQGETLVYSMDLVKLLPKRSLNTKFYFYLLSWERVRKIMKSLARGTNVLHLDLNLTKKLKVIEPPLEEQNRIANILSTIDRTIELYHGERERLERLKRGLMSELLTGRIRVREENGRLSFHRETELRETDIGKIPRDWKVKKLGEITTEMYYGLTAKAVEQGTGLRMLRTTDIKDYKVDWSSLPYCEVTDYRNYNLRKYLLRKNDIIISRAGTAGVSVLVDRDFDDIIFGSYLIKVRLNEAFVHPKFIHYYMQSDLYWKQILPRQAGSTLKNISIPILKSIIIPLPSTNEQVKIAEILSTIDRAIELYREEMTRLERLKRGLMDLLLTGKVRVVDGDVGS